MPPPTRAAAAYASLADDLVRAHHDGDRQALDRLGAHDGRARTRDDVRAEAWRRVYALRQRSNRGGSPDLRLDEARLWIAQDAGYGSWDALLAALEDGTPPVPTHEVDPGSGALVIRRPPSPAEWTTIVAFMRERGVTALDANGTMTDQALAAVATLPHVTSLSIGGSRGLSDAGLLLLARMPQLERLDLSEHPGGAWTDHGLAVLQALPSLRHFEMTWQSGVSDVGVAYLAACDRLEHVNVMGTPTGDGVIAALEGKTALRSLSTGRLVTDAGLARLHQLPRFATTSGMPDEGARLLVDGPFSNAGLAALAGLDGVRELDMFWHVSVVSTDGFGALAALPQLEVLGADGRLSDDEAMRHFAALPRLRRLRAQGTHATDAGFEALARSATLESLWGRECPRLTGRGFRALGTMPALRGLGVSCKQVDDEALATLPSFPALAELTPIDVTDDGFRHVGRCARLTRLSCMYCRDTTDEAVAHVTGLPLRYYYAGLTQITDDGLERLATIRTLEQVDLYECLKVTDAGMAHLARLPGLVEVNLDGMPGVTLAGTGVFHKHVRVRYST